MDASLLARLVIDRAGQPGAAWFREAVGRLEGAVDLASFTVHFAAAGRRLGRASIRLTAEERAAGAPALLECWALDECGRVALLAKAVRLLPWESHPGLVDDLYRRGELREQQAVLRALSLLPDPQRFGDVAADACRSHAQPVFESLACDNPFPAACMPDASFNQLVVKALFTGAPLDRILGLADRHTSELVRMAEAFASERAAAGRPVPDDVARLREMRRRRTG